MALTARRPAKVLILDEMESATLDRLLICLENPEVVAKLPSIGIHLDGPEYQTTATELWQRLYA